MAQKNECWDYIGEVLVDGKFHGHTERSTWAPSKQRAISNMTHQYRNRHDIPKTKKISLNPKKVKLHEFVGHHNVVECDELDQTPEQLSLF